jgi:hypothetical protein
MFNKRMSLESIVNYFKQRDLNGGEIENLVGKYPILYSDLKKYESLTSLLGKHNYIVVLYQTSSKTTGHYVSISFNPEINTIRFCDSYGFPMDTEQQYAAYDKPLPKYLSILVEKHIRDHPECKFEFNTHDYQRKSSKITTCGRYSSLFSLFYKVPLIKIHEMLRMNHSAFLSDPDNVATILTLVGLNNIQDYLR